jgi:exopolyphosphatase/guanosine-5'-triphosphate,3'-diphosphate pyrophosphatase
MAEVAIGVGPDDYRRVEDLLGRPPRCAFDVVVRDGAGDPIVIRNAPFLDDGTPMPTRFWLVGRSERLAVDRLESGGGVRAAESAVDAATIAVAHRRYAAERDAAIPAGWTGPRPSGGVGGTSAGVKCLHAHYAWFLAGGNDPVGAWVARQFRHPPAAVAAIDCGTNSTRLLVADATGAPRERLMRITRLGQGVDHRGALAPDAIARTVGVLEEFRSVLDHHRVGRLRMTATSAARDASNREQFFTAAAAAIGQAPELLDGDEEGRLSFLGATAELDPSTGPWLVADIGGGSTELAAGPAPKTAPGGPTAGVLYGEPVAVRSLDVGCVRVTERFLTTDPPARDELHRARAHVAALLQEVSESDPAFATGRTLVGLAGTVAALAAIEQRLDHYDRSRIHHYRLSRAGVDGLLEILAAEPAAARRRRPGMETDRADVIVGGAVVLAEIMRHFGFEECWASEADILDGLVATQLVI